MAVITKNVNELVAVSRTIKGTSFVSVRNYRNQAGELSNYIILVGANHNKIMRRDLGNLIERKYKVFSMLKVHYSDSVIKIAYDNIYWSLVNRLSDDITKEKLRLQGNKTILAQDLQNEMYDFISTGVKQHKTNQSIYIFGYGISKTILEKGKLTKKKELTDIQKCELDIKRLCKFRNDKYRNFIFCEAEIKMKGFNL